MRLEWVLHTESVERGCVVEGYTPDWRSMSEIAETIRRARLVMVDAQEMRLTSLECRHRAAVLRAEAERLRADAARNQIALVRVGIAERALLLASGASRRVGV
jgi:hypothetical protein